MQGKNKECNKRLFVFSSNVEDDNEPPVISWFLFKCRSSSLSLGFFPQMQKMTTSQNGPSLLSSLGFFLSVEDDNGPPSSSSFFGFFPQMQKMMMSHEAFGSSSSLSFFLRCRR
jgi:hypothetical protein